MNKQGLGSLRSVDDTSAMVVLSNGVYLTFRVPANKKAVSRNVVEVDRWRRRGPEGTPRVRETIEIDPYTLGRIRRGVADAIKRSRALKTRLKPPVVQLPRKAYQLVLPLSR